MNQPFIFLEVFPLIVRDPRTIAIGPQSHVALLERVHFALERPVIRSSGWNFWPAEYHSSALAIGSAD